MSAWHEGRKEEAERQGNGGEEKKRKRRRKRTKRRKRRRGEGACNTVRQNNQAVTNCVK